MENNTILYGTGSLNVLLRNSFEHESQPVIDFKPSPVLFSPEVRHFAVILLCFHLFTYRGDLCNGKKSLHSTTGGKRKEQKEKRACD